MGIIPFMGICQDFLNSNETKAGLGHISKPPYEYLVVVVVVVVVVVIDDKHNFSKFYLLLGSSY